MKKITLALLSTVLLSLCVFAASDRLDFINTDQSFTSIFINDIKEISYLPNEANTGYEKVNIEYNNGEMRQFDMASLSSIKYSKITRDYLEITRTGDDHSRVIMLDCINNDGVIDNTKDNDYTAQRAGAMVHFKLYVELGFDAVHIVTGRFSGKVYTDIPGYVYILPRESEDNFFGQDCLAFAMPYEPVDIRTVSTERTTYNGMDFLGTYKGYPVAVGENRLLKGNEPQFDITFKGNETYALNSTDQMGFSFVDLYNYDADAKTFHYQVIEAERLDYHEFDTYGASGQFFGSNNLLIDVNNVSNDTPDNIVRYFASKAAVNYVCAARDDYGYQYLLEVAETEAPNTTTWFFLNNYGYIKKEAVVEFISGTTIGLPCEAKVSYDGELQFKYVLNEGGQPQFVAKGNEAGTYTSTDGSNIELVLDGFGEMQYGEATYSYEIESSIVTAVIDGTTRLFVLDIENKTYIESQGDVWDGAVTYTNENVLGVSYSGVENSLNKVTVTFDYNLIGNAKPGFASISVDLHVDPGYRNVVADCQRYIYIKETKTLILSNVLTGSATGATGRRNIVFTISDDMTKLYLEGEGEETKIYGTAGGYVVPDINNALVGEPEISE